MVLMEAVIAVRPSVVRPDHREADDVTADGAVGRRVPCAPYQCRVCAAAFTAQQRRTASTKSTGSGDSGRAPVGAAGTVGADDVRSGCLTGGGAALGRDWACQGEYNPPRPGRVDPAHSLSRLLTASCSMPTTRPAPASRSASVASASPSAGPLTE